MTQKKRNDFDPASYDEDGIPVYDHGTSLMEMLAVSQRMPPDRGDQTITVTSVAVLGVLADQSHMKIVLEVRPTKAVLMECRRIVKPGGVVVHDGAVLDLPTPAPPPHMLMKKKPARLRKRSPPLATP